MCHRVLPHLRLGLILLLFAFLSPLCQAATAPADSGTTADGPRDLPAILKSGVLRVAMLKTDEMPFFYHNKQGQFTGIDVQLLAMIQKQLDVKVQLIRTATTFDGVVDMVADGQADLAMSYLSITTTRARRVAYTRPYAFSYYAVAVNRVAQAQARVGSKVGPFLNRPQTRLGVQMGSTYEVFAREHFPRATLVSIADSKDNLDAVIQGKVDAFVNEGVSLEPMFKQNPKLNFLLHTVIYHQAPDLIAGVVPPESDQLLHWMNTFLKLEDLNGTLDRIKAENGITVEQNKGQ